MGGSPGRERLEAARQALAAAEQAAAGGVPEQVREDREPEPENVARQIVLRQLAAGPRTRAQLRQRLDRRGCDPDVAERVLDRMTQVGLVDDAAYARMFVHSKQETKGLAARAISHELREKGVDQELIDAALEDVDTEVEKEQARALVAKRVRQVHGLDREVQTRRLAGFLARKGYGPGVAFDVIREALDAAPEHQRD